jgi:hypothetical protein
VRYDKYMSLGGKVLSTDADSCRCTEWLRLEDKWRENTIAYRAPPTSHKVLVPGLRPLVLIRVVRT